MDAYQVTLDAPLARVSRPRLWRLLVGVLCLGVAFVLLVLEAPPMFWDTQALGDARLAGWGLLLVGTFHALRSMRTDLLRVRQVRFNKHELQLTWTHVPCLTGPWVEASTALPWDQLAACQWVEGDDEHELRQYLLIRFKQPLGSHTDELRVLISDGRRTRHCRRLLSYLPDRLQLPEWMQHTNDLPAQA